MPGLLYPAYQKLYSALSSLDRFNKEANFFDNISCIDNFFTEYRNVTFVMQASLKHTQYYEDYEANRDKYLDHWFVDKRNQTTKQRPFPLVKKIEVNVFFSYHGYSVLERSYSVEDDTPLEALYDELKALFAEIETPEIFFSVTYSFHDGNSSEELLSKLMSGVSQMLAFMKAMDSVIAEECPLCNQLKDKINAIKIPKTPQDILLINDYVYYVQQELFERGERVAMLMCEEGGNALSHIPISSITERAYLNFDGTVFGNFTLQHAILRCLTPGGDILTTILIVFSDKTYTLDIFQADIKTTFYRKINETARIIANSDVIEVCIVTLYAFIPASADVSPLSKERLKQATNDCLVCASIDSELNEKEYVFDGKKMENPKYVANVMRQGYKKQLDYSKRNLFPVFLAFSRKQKR